MKKIISFLLALIFAGCAAQSSNVWDTEENTGRKKSTTVKEARPINEKSEANLSFYGAYKTNIIGPVSWDNAGRCNKNKFIKQVMDSKQAHNAINIMMIESCTTEDSKTSCKCSYTGLGVTYTAINAEEASLWSNLQTQEVATP